MKKRTWLLFMSICVIASLILSACGGKSSSSDGEDSDKYESSQSFLRISSGPMGSGWYAMTASFSELWMDEFKSLNVSQLEGGGLGNLHVIDEGADAQMGISYSPEFMDAKEGRGEFKGAKKDNIAAFGSLTPVINYFAVSAKRDDIKSIEDLLDKKVFLGPRDAGGTISLFRVLEEYGITEETFKENGGSLLYGSWADGASQLGDGIVDAWFGASPPGEANTSIAEIDITTPIKMIGFDEEILKKVKEKGIGLDYAPGGDIYSGQKEEELAFTMETVLFVSKDLDEEFVYNLSKSLWENTDKLGGLSENRVAMLTTDSAMSSIDASYLHPGAAKYFKEVGVLE